MKRILICLLALFMLSSLVTGETLPQDQPVKIPEIGELNCYQLAPNIRVGANLKLDLLFLATIVGSDLTHKGYGANLEPWRTAVSQFYSRYTTNKNARRIFEISMTEKSNPAKKFGTSYVTSVVAFNEVLQDNERYIAANSPPTSLTRPLKEFYQNYRTHIQPHSWGLFCKAVVFMPWIGVNLTSEKDFLEVHRNNYVIFG